MYRMKNFLAGLVALCWSATLIAMPMHPAEQVVRDTTTRVLTALDDEVLGIRKDLPRLYELVNDTVLPHFDFQRMSRRVLGKHWRKADAGQRSRFTREFQVLLVRTYATALLEYSDQKIIYLPVRKGSRTSEAVIRTEVRPPGGMPIPIGYAMYDGDGDWKVYDVSIDGVSLVINYRASFNSQIRREGLDGLINKLAKRNKVQEK